MITSQVILGDKSRIWGLHLAPGAIARHPLQPAGSRREAPTVVPRLLRHQTFPVGQPLAALQGPLAAERIVTTSLAVPGGFLDDTPAKGVIPTTDLTVAAPA
ncbi:hypothetical protein Vafri_1060, partial [Volvox africanus]